MTPLILATRNQNKTREFAQILGADFSVTDLSQLGEMPMIEETGKTFEENAALKAVAISRLTNGLIVADDSGLEVQALDGAPGIYSARYAGEHATDEENVARLLRELDSLGEAAGSRDARFRCVLALARDGITLKAFSGDVTGRVTRKTRGQLGFGYDPVFVADGYTKTFAELGDKVKSKISHRANAAEKLRTFLETAPRS